MLGGPPGCLLNLELLDYKIIIFFIVHVLYDTIYITYTSASKWIKKLKVKMWCLFIWVHPQSFRNNLQILYADVKSTGL